MFESWLNFGFIVLIQFFLFIIHAIYLKKTKEILSILKQSIPGGLVLGLFFDLIFGKLLGMYSYTVGFNLLPLIIIAVFGYGLFVAHVLLMKKMTLVHFWVRVMIVAAVFEVANLFFPTWTWEFSWSLPEYLLIQSAGNFGAAILIALLWHTYLNKQFFFINKLNARWE